MLVLYLEFWDVWGSLRRLALLSSSRAVTQRWVSPFNRQIHSKGSFRVNFTLFFFLNRCHVTLLSLCRSPLKALTSVSAQAHGLVLPHKCLWILLLQCSQTSPRSVHVLHSLLRTLQLGIKVPTNKLKKAFGIWRIEKRLKDAAPLNLVLMFQMTLYDQNNLSSVALFLLRVVSWQGRVESSKSILSSAQQI